MQPAHLSILRRTAQIAAVALSSLLIACTEEPPPRAPSSAAGAGAGVRASAWLAHLGPEDRQYQDAIVALVASGDEAILHTAAQNLVAWARAVTSVAWRDAGRERLRAANAAARIELTPEQVEGQLDQYRDELLTRVLSGMERVGGPEAVSFAFEVAENDAMATRPRQAALAVMAKLVDRRDASVRTRAAIAWERVSARAAAEASPKPGGSVSNAQAVVAGMAPGFRRCYNMGLLEDRDMKGSVRVTAKIGVRGEVISVSPSGSGLSPKVVSCVTARVAEAVFSPPEGGGATVVIPVTFVTAPDQPIPLQAPAPASP